MITIDAAMTDKSLLGAALGDTKSWTTWRAVLRATFGLSLNADQRATFATVAGDREPPTKRVSELWAVVARRSGKTRMAAAVSVYIGAIVKHRLAPGEEGFVLLLAASRSQATVAFRYVVGYLESSPVLRQQIETVTNDEVRLKGGITIGVHTNSFRTIRGRTLLAVVGDETAFWRDESSAQPDVETYRACIPALAAANGIWIGISSGYRKIGLLYQKWKDHYGVSSDDVLVIQGSTEQFNPTIDKAVIARAMKADPEAAISEWGGAFRNDISSFLNDGLIDAAIVLDRPLELPPRPRIEYKCFVDASGGRHDAYTLCIAHREDDEFVVDVIRGKRPPFDPQAVTREYADLVKAYGIRSLRGDNYSAEWVHSAWRQAGIIYERSELNKSALYLEALPQFARGLVRLPEHPLLIRELRLLERRTSRNGKDTVDHGRNGSDDHANSLAGVLQSLAVRSKWPNYDDSLSWIDTQSLSAANRATSLKAFLESTSPKRATFKNGATLMEN
jgi:hypothetical protein